MSGDSIARFESRAAILRRRLEAIESEALDADVVAAILALRRVLLARQELKRACVELERLTEGWR
jgi:hypothetical protein